jgi:leucyl/phenylalanyl-tRNA--protein transferase
VRLRLPWIDPTDPLPAPDQAPGDAPIAAGLDLSARRLIEAYRQGIFPWYNEGQPVLWWSPDPRMVLRLADFKVSRSLRKVLRSARREGHWTLSLDRAFPQVMAACAAPRGSHGHGTWITAAIRQAYGELHRLGMAHSVETWRGDTLVGGLYGVAIGRMFYGESMFARETDASKAALAGLVALLRSQDFRVIDCQQETGHLASLGAAPEARADFLREMRELTALPPPDWSSLRIALPDA